MKKALLLSVLIMMVGASRLIAKESIIMRCFLPNVGEGRIELYLPGGKYEKIDLPKWGYKDEKEAQLAISKKIEALNQQGFNVVSFSETFNGAGPFGLISTYILTKD